MSYTNDALKLLDITASFIHVVSPTPFAVYDADPLFQVDADGMVKLVYNRLGGNILQVELTNKDVYSALEQACLEYSSIINTYQAKSVLTNIMGSMTGSLSGYQNQNPRMDLSFAKRLAEGFSSEAGVGGSKTLYSASISLRAGQQHYDINGYLSASNIIPEGSRAEIRQIFHFDPVAAYRFFDTSSAINYLNNQFQFESFTPETIFYVLPIWEDILRGSQLELNQKVRRSNYSFNIVNNTISIYPVPTNSDARLHFTYYLNGGLSGSAYDASNPYTNGVSNLSNVPFGNIEYYKVNSIGKQWIKKAALAFAKETLGRVRGKMSEIPIPNGSLVLDGPQLIQEGMTEIENLRNELKEWLDSMTYDKLAQKEQDQAEALQRVLMKIPLGIFIY